MIAVVHLHPTLTVPPAIAGVLLTIWYWRRLGMADVPASRRAIRRISMIMMLGCMLLVPIGLSYADGDLRPSPTWYVTTWFAVFAFLTLLVLTAIADFFNNLRLRRYEVEDHHVHVAAELYRLSKGEPAGEADERDEGAPG